MIADTPTKVLYQCNGSTTVFPFSFTVEAQADLRVLLVDSSETETELTINTEYTVTIDPVLKTGSITTVAWDGAAYTASPYSSAYRLQVSRDTEKTQDSDLKEGGVFSAEAMEDAMDKMTRLTQENSERLDRAALLPETSQETISFPTPTARKILGWDASGTALTNYSTETVTSAVFDHIGNYADLATAISTIGAAVTTLVIDVSTVIADGTSVTTPDTLSLMIINGGSIDGVAGGSTETLTINGPLVSGNYQIFGENLTVSGLKSSNVFWFGAKGDGTTDDTTAVQRAIDAVTDSTLNLSLLAAYSTAQYPTEISGTVLFPGGTYSLTATINVEACTQLFGDGNASSVIRADSGFVGTNIVLIGRSDYWWIYNTTVRDIKILDNTGNNLVGIEARNLHDWNINNVTIADCSIGVLLNGSAEGTIENSRIYKNTIGIASYNLTEGIWEVAADNINISNSIIHWNGTGISIGGSRLFDIRGCFIQENDVVGISTNSSTIISGEVSRLVNVRNSYFEANGRTGNVQISGDILQFNFKDNHIAHYLSGDYFIDAEDMVNINMVDNSIIESRTPQTTEGSLVYISATSSIEYLRYERNIPDADTGWLNSPIVNNKTGFCPEPVYFSDFDGGGIGPIQNIEEAFNGVAGTVFVDKDYEGRFLIDFPVKMIGVKNPTVTKLSTFTPAGIQSALVILSDNVYVEGVSFITDDSDITFTYGDAVSTYNNATVKNCSFQSDDDWCVVSNLNTKNLKFESCTVNRSGTAGYIFYMVGRGGFISNPINISPTASTAAIDVSGRYNKVIDNGDITWTNAGGATNAIL